MSKAKRNKTVAASVVAGTSTRSDSSVKQHGWKTTALGSALIIALVFAVYFPALHGEFLWDDLPVFIEHPIITSANGLETIWLKTVWLTTDFPLTLTTFWIEHRLWGHNPTGYHATNFLLHALGAILLWRVLLQLKIRAAFAAALVFAVHPVCVASVAWISERKNTLSLVFFLLALWAYLKTQIPAPATGDKTTRLKRRSPAFFYIGSILFFFLALLSKTSVVGLPLVLLAIAWWQYGKISTREFLKSVPFFLMSLGFGLLTIYAQKTNAIRGEIVQTENFIERLAESAWAIWFYAWKAIAPLNLMAIYPRWELREISLVAFLPLAALIGIFLFFWSRRNGWGRHAILALGFFVTMLFPVLGFFDMYFLIFSRVADQWQYVPLIGVVVPAVSGIAYFFEKHTGATAKAKVLSCVAIVSVLAAMTWNFSKVYFSEENLWTGTIRKNPRAWMAYNNLGRIYYQQGRVDDAIRLFTESLRLNPNHAETHNNFGLALTEQRKLDQAVSEFSEAIRLKRAQPIFHFNLGIALAKQGKLEAAIAAYQEALKLEPDYASVHNNLSSALHKIGRHEESLEHSQRALRKRPNFPEAHYNAANALVALGRLDKAFKHFSVALKLRPNFPDALLDWGFALAINGNFEEASRRFEEMIRLNPKDANAHAFLANSLAAQKKFAEAVAHYEIALRFQPDEAQTHYNLGNTLALQGNLAKAKAHYSEALRLKPDYVEAKRALNLAQNGQPNGLPEATHPVTNAP